MYDVKVTPIRCLTYYIWKVKKLYYTSSPRPPSFILLSSTLGTINVAKFAEGGGGEFFFPFHAQFKRSVFFFFPISWFFCSYFLIFLFLKNLSPCPGWNPVTAPAKACTCITYSALGDGSIGSKVNQANQTTHIRSLNSIIVMKSYSKKFWKLLYSWVNSFHEPHGSWAMAS